MHARCLRAAIHLNENKITVQTEDIRTQSLEWTFKIMLELESAFSRIMKLHLIQILKRSHLYTHYKTFQLKMLIVSNNMYIAFFLNYCH